MILTVIFVILTSFSVVTLAVILLLSALYLIARIRRRQNPSK